MMTSALYTGTVRHRRFSPKAHDFEYRVFMMYLCLREIDEVLSLSPICSNKPWSFACFRRRDFHGDPEIPLADAVKDTVEKHLGKRPLGDVCMLANLRYFGCTMNPLVTYYCFNEANDRLEAIVAEVTNTPWKERCTYVLGCKSEEQVQKFVFDKNFTVSPFNVSDMQYAWYSSEPEESLDLHINSLLDGKKVTDATLRLRREPLTTGSLNRVILKFPFMTMKVLLGIYWQALRLFLKGVPFLGKSKTSVTMKKIGAGRL